MSQFPIAPRYARMLVATEQRDLLPYMIMAVAALSVDDLFIDENYEDKQNEDSKQKQQRIRAVKKIWTQAVSL